MPLEEVLVTALLDVIRAALTAEDPHSALAAAKRAIITDAADATTDAALGVPPYRVD